VTLSELLKSLDDGARSGALRHDAEAIALVRNVDVQIESEGAWTETPVSEVRFDPDEGSVDLVTGIPGAALAVSALESHLRDNLSERPNYQLYVVHDFQRVEGDWWTWTHAPVVATAFNPDTGGVAFVPHFKGWRKVFA
jgi:hypothetical protein